MQVKISKDIDELSRQVAEWMVDYIHGILRLADRCTIALTGGSTPRTLYSLLATPGFRNRIDWQKLHIFWGDERYVPFTDDRNNAKMAFDSLLNHVPVPAAQIHVMRTDIAPEDSANEYESLLKIYFPAAAPDSKLKTQKSQPAPPDSRLAAHNSQPATFDLTLLGLGDNAHTLSLFPGEEVIHEDRRWVRAVFVREVNMERITLTAPVVNRSKCTIFIASGPGKAEAVAHVLGKDYRPDLYPAQVIKPANDELFWFLDQAAARNLNS